MSVIVPPIKCQGIKTKLIPRIRTLVGSNKFQRWIEPFSGSGVVAFNIIPKHAVLCDTNPHIINFYNAIESEEITGNRVKVFLKEEGARLAECGEEYYYEVRDRFNKNSSPLDFLFLNRSCFNGVMRFNRKGRFNVPFCRKENRFAQAYITKISNQVDNVSKIIKTNHFMFICQSFEKTLAEASSSDFVYCDPPYIDRHTDYFNSWQEADELKLFELLKKTSAKFIFSTWKGNIYRENSYLKRYASDFTMITQKHYYHVGGDIGNRHSMEEALLLNFPAPVSSGDDESYIQGILAL